MANQVAIMCAVKQRGSEIIVGPGMHMADASSGAVPVLAGA